MAQSENTVRGSIMRRALFNALFSVLLAFSVVTLASAQDTVAPAEIAQIREQLQELSRRVDRLEEENKILKAQNDRLKSQDKTLYAQTRGLREDTTALESEIEKGGSAAWAGRVALKGDVRYRHEQIRDDSLDSSGAQSTADRYRDRVRARIRADIEATETIELGIGFATSEGGDPRSANQTLDGVFSRKSLYLDLAYMDWQFANWGALTAGKMKQPFFKPGQSLFWDKDINPEGIALGFERGIYFGTAYNYWIDEVSGPQSELTSDTMLHGVQVGVRLPVRDASLALAAHYYDLSSGEGRAPFHNGRPNGNTTIEPIPGMPVLANDYQVINLGAELNARLGELPFQVWADIAQNQDASDLDTAWAAGVLFGEADSARSWELGAAYQVVEKDALFAQLIDATFGAGNSDNEGFVLRAAYAPVRNWLLNATYFMNERNTDVANSAGQRGVEYDRLQLDMSVKF